MHRTDRLFQLIQFLQQKKTATAAQLAEHLEVSERTIYRYIQTLVLSKIPILGEAGVGYRLAHGFHLPSLMFTARELEALVLGARMVEAWGDLELAQGASAALAKIENGLPLALKNTIAATTLFAPDFHIPEHTKQQLGLLRKAISEQHYISFHYVRADGVPSSRTARPLGLFFWGPRWSIAAFCEDRHDFRNFRLDRMSQLIILQKRFQIELGKTLQDAITAMEKTKAIPMK